jgi:hypothetical protein
MSNKCATLLSQSTSVVDRILLKGTSKNALFILRHAQDDTIFFEFNLKIDVMVSLSNHEDNY